MKLIVGLGNPGEKYAKTRHNVGFMMLDYIVMQAKSEKLIVKNHNEKFKTDKYSNAESLKIELNGEEILLAKPHTYMNESGVAVQRLVSRYTLHVAQELFVIHDDLDIPFGKFKIQKGRGPELHYGVTSVENHLKTKDFWRVRIGIDNRVPKNRIAGIDYTLQNFTSEEFGQLENIFKEIWQSLQSSFRLPS